MISKNSNENLVKFTREDRAFLTVETWAQGFLKDYREPTRAGTPKGEPIGLSKQKYHASLLMILHPNCLKLKDIAKKVGVSEGTLRVWRTEEGFKKAVHAAFSSFAEFLNYIMASQLIKDEIEDIQIKDNRKKNEKEVFGKNLTAASFGGAMRIFNLNGNGIAKIDNGKLKIMKTHKRYLEIIKDKFSDLITDVKEIDILPTHSIVADLTNKEQLNIYLITILPLLNIKVTEIFLTSLLKYEYRGVSQLLVMLLIAGAQHEGMSVRGIIRIPEVLTYYKNYISRNIDDLADPEIWKQVSVEKIQEEARELKKDIFQLIDRLAT